MAAVIARNQALDDLFRTAATLEMTMVFVCLGMQNLAEQCASVPDFGERFCLNCKDKGFGTGLSNFNQKLCITDYMTVSLWAYCPSLPPGLRIIRDRIIIPVRCSCLSVRCDPIPDWKK
nr:hypothetical protein BaRGS_013299 [Batillaria attramentaria]